MERFDEVDLSGCQVPSNDSIAPSGSHDDISSHDTKSHDPKSHDPKSHDPVTSSATKHVPPVGKPPSGASGSVSSKVDKHRVAGELGL